MIADEPALVGLLLLLALPLGLALTADLLPAQSRVARLGTATLAGLGAILAAAHALVCVGVRGSLAMPIVAAASLVAAAAWIARRRRGPPAPTTPDLKPGRGLGAAALEILPLAACSLLLLNELGSARNFGLTEHDAIRIWAPKAARALDEAPPDLRDEQAHAHPEYPRGLGLLTAAVSAPLGRLDARVIRLVPLFLFALTLLAVFDALSARRNAAGGFAAMLILGSLPFLLRQSASGLADVPMSAFVLIGIVGLAPQRGDRPSIGTTLAGGLGAMAVKDEGLAFCAALVVVLALRLMRARAPLRAASALATVAVLAAPWVALRSRAAAGTPLLLGSIVENLGLLLIRFDAMVRELGHLALGFPDPSPGGFELASVHPGREPVLHVAALCGIVLMVGRRPGIPVLPVGLLLLSDFGAILLSDAVVDWQLVTATSRLVLQCLPALLVAALDKFAGAPAISPRAAEARADASG